MFIIFATTNISFKKDKFSSFLGFYKVKNKNSLFYDGLHERKIESERHGRPLFKEFSHWQYKFRI